MKRMLLLSLLLMSGIIVTLSVIIEGPQNSLKKYGERVVLKCKTKNGNCAGIDWKKQEGNASPKPVYQDGQGMLNADVFPPALYSVSPLGGCSLLITNLKLEDSGKFICIETADGSQYTRSAVLVVIDIKAACEANARNVFRGDKSIMQCVVSIPAKTTEPTDVTLSWFDEKGTRLITSLNNEQRISNLSSLSYTAIVDGLTVPKYKCSASFSPEQQLNYDSTPANLDVCETPEIPVSSIVEGPRDSLKKFGERIELICKTDKGNCDGIDWKKQEGNASPKPVYQYSHGMLNSDVFPPARYNVSDLGTCILSITNLKLEDSGKFICVENKAGQQYAKSAVLEVTAIISSPGMQRKSRWDTCTFEWKVSIPVGRCTVYKLTTGRSLPLSANANYTVDTSNGIVTLTIRNIQLWDAGNYSLSVTVGNTTQTDTGALLFVYGPIEVKLRQTSGPNPATEGQTVEVSCVVNSTSLPIAYRPTIYYFWRFDKFGVRLYDISSGLAVRRKDGSLSGYNIKNNGRTVVIDSFECEDMATIQCSAYEEGTSRTYFPHFHLEFPCRPVDVSGSAGSGIQNIDLFRQVSLSIQGISIPSLTSFSNWTFVDRAGRARDLPATVVPSPRNWFGLKLSFNLTSERFYGNYWISARNRYGSMTETFQVRPPGPPDKPSEVKVLNVSHDMIAVQWSVGWHNRQSTNGVEQTIFVAVNAVGNNTVLGAWNYDYNADQFHKVHSHTFANKIKPETDYEVKIWSTNDLGSSDVVRLRARTLPDPNLLLSGALQGNSVSTVAPQAIPGPCAVKDDDDVEVVVVFKGLKKLLGIA